MSDLPQEFFYSEEHEWVNAAADAVEGQTVRIGITSVATERLGEIVFAELPAVGDTVTAGETCGEVESTKSVSDIYAPVSGEIVAVNEALDADPGAINSDPYGKGWLFDVKLSDASELGSLLTADDYNKQVG